MKTILDPNDIPQLPGDVIALVADNLPFEDHLSLTKISKSTRRILSREEGRGYHKPWLMLSNKPGEKTRRFYSPLEGKVYNVNLPKTVRRSWCVGSYQGWLILAHKTRRNFVYNPITQVRFRLPTHELENVHYTSAISLNYVRNYVQGSPRTHRQHVKRCPYFLSKVVLSNVPPSSSSSTSSSSPLLAAAITENHMILITVCDPGQVDYKWRQFCPAYLVEDEKLLSPFVQPIYRRSDVDRTVYDEEEEVELKIVNECKDYNDDEIYDGDVRDIIFYKGDLYAVNTYARLVVLSLTEDHQDFLFRRVDIHPLKLIRKELNRFFNTYYLVESCHGGLLLVVRNRDYNRFLLNDRYRGGVWRFQTNKFVVFWLDETTGEPFRWVRMESLGDQVLILGQNNSVSVSSAHLNGKRNCIYFTDRLPSHYYIDISIHETCFYKDVGVYHYEDGRVENLVPDELESHLHILMRQPIFFTPNP